MGVYTGPTPTLLSGELADATKLKQITDFMAAATGAMIPWTPTLTNMVQGNGLLVADYSEIGKTLDFEFKLTLGSTSTVTTNPQFTLPSGAFHAAYSVEQILMTCTLGDTGVAIRQGVMEYMGSGALRFFSLTSTGVAMTVSATAPHTWAAGDVMACMGRLRRA